jgi:hypothetical protein
MMMPTHLPLFRSASRIACTLLLSSLSTCLLAEEVRPDATSSLASITGGDRPKSGEHKAAPVRRDLLSEAIELVQKSHDRLHQEIDDYTCRIAFRMRVDDRLSEEKTALVKVRHEDNVEKGISLYLKFESPKSVKGREVLFSNAGENDRMLVRRGGPRLGFLTMELEPTCAMAMKGNLYPITEFGLRNLAVRMLECASTELEEGSCEVVIGRDADLEGRSCTTIDVVHSEKRDSFKFHRAKIYFDDEHQIPVRYEAYGWPEADGDDPPLNEEYTYRDLKFNVGLQDSDFDRENAEYRFAKRD